MADDQPKKPVTITREELYRQVWETPMQRLAAQYGISGNGLAKTCDRMQVPYPARGYWAKRDAGKAVSQTALPPSRTGTPANTVITPTPPPVPAPTMSVEVKQQYEKATAQASDIIVPDTLRRPHPLIAGWIADRARQVAAAKRDRDRYSLGFAPQPFGAIDDRRHRILDTLFKELEKRGFKIKTEQYKGQWLEVSGERVDFTLHEHIRQVRRPLTPEQLRSPMYSGQRWTQTKEPTGNLLFVIKTYLGVGICEKWSDEPDSPLEGQIGAIVATLSLAGPLLTERRKIAAERERQRLEAEHLRQQEADKRRRDKHRVRRFVELANRWSQAETARLFLAALEARTPSSEAVFDGKTHDDWIAWARARLTDYDPLSGGSEGVWDNLAKVTHWEYPN